MTSARPLVVPLTLSSRQYTHAQLCIVEGGEGCGALYVPQHDGYILVSLTEADRRASAEGSCIMPSGEHRNCYQLYPREVYADVDLATQALTEYIERGRHRVERELGWRLFGHAYIQSVGTIEPGVHVIHLSTGERGLLCDSVSSKEHNLWGGTYHFGFYYFPFSGYRAYLEESHPHWIAHFANIEALEAWCMPKGPRLDLTSGLLSQRVTLFEKSQVGKEDLNQASVVVSCFGEASSSSKDWQLQGPWQAAEIEPLEGAFRQVISWHPGLNFLEAWKRENVYPTISGTQCHSTWYEVIARFPYRTLHIYAQSLDELMRSMLSVFLHQEETAVSASKGDAHRRVEQALSLVGRQPHSIQQEHRKG